jgi:hypothetical protein
MHTVTMTKSVRISNKVSIYRVGQRSGNLHDPLTLKGMFGPKTASEFVEWNRSVVCSSLDMEDLIEQFLLIH